MIFDTSGVSFCFVSGARGTSGSRQQRSEAGLAVTGTPAAFAASARFCVGDPTAERASDWKIVAPMAPPETPLIANTCREKWGLASCSFARNKDAADAA